MKTMDNIMKTIFEKTELTDADYISIGEHFKRLMPCDGYDRGRASQCQDCEHCDDGVYDYNDVYVPLCGSSADNRIDDNMECSNGYCPYREFGKDIVELLTSELNKTEEP